MVDHLPLMGGWEFQGWTLDVPATVVKNRVDLIHRFDDYDGWLLGASVVCDDAFAVPYIHYPTIPPIAMMPYAYSSILGINNWGAQEIYCPAYYRPSPYSSAGLYIVEYQSAYPMPYKTRGLAGKKGEYRLEVLAGLDTSSTQSSAHILYMECGRIVITEPEVFKRDLKRVLGVEDITKAVLQRR